MCICVHVYVSRDGNTHEEIRGQLSEAKTRLPQLWGYGYSNVWLLMLFLGTDSAWVLSSAPPLFLFCHCFRLAWKITHFLIHFICVYLGFVDSSLHSLSLYPHSVPFVPSTSLSTFLSHVRLPSLPTPLKTFSFLLHGFLTSAHTIPHKYTHVTRAIYESTLMSSQVTILNIVFSSYIHFPANYMFLYSWIKFHGDCAPHFHRLMDIKNSLL